MAPLKTVQVGDRRVQIKSLTVFQREDTFTEGKVRWPHLALPSRKSTASPEALAYAGFFFKPSKGMEDNVGCFECGVEFTGWAGVADPFARHCSSELGAACKYAQLVCRPVTVDPASGAIVSRPREELEQMYIVDGVNMLRESPDVLGLRYDTFGRKWPQTSQGKVVRPSARSMAEAGFYLCQSRPDADDDGKDTTKCAVCLNELSQWTADDNPVSEHRRKKPDCLYFYEPSPAEHTAPAGEEDDVDVGLTMPAPKTRGRKAAATATTATAASTRPTRRGARKAAAAESSSEVDESDVGDASDASTTSNMSVASNASAMSIVSADEIESVTGTSTRSRTARGRGKATAATARRGAAAGGRRGKAAAAAAESSESENEVAEKEGEEQQQQQREPVDDNKVDIELPPPKRARNSGSRAASPAPDTAATSSPESLPTSPRSVISAISAVTRRGAAATANRPPIGSTAISRSRNPNLRSRTPSPTPDATATVTTTTTAAVPVPASRTASGTARPPAAAATATASTLGSPPPSNARLPPVRMTRTTRARVAQNEATPTAAPAETASAEAVPVPVSRTASRTKHAPAATAVPSAASRPMSPNVPRVAAGRRAPTPVQSDTEQTSASEAESTTSAAAGRGRPRRAAPVTTATTTTKTARGGTAAARGAARGAARTATKTTGKTTAAAASKQKPTAEEKVVEPASSEMELEVLDNLTLASSSSSSAEPGTAGMNALGDFSIDIGSDIPDLELTIPSRPAVVAVPKVKPVEAEDASDAASQETHSQSQTQSIDSQATVLPFSTASSQATQDSQSNWKSRSSDYSDVDVTLYGFDAEDADLTMHEWTQKLISAERRRLHELFEDQIKLFVDESLHVRQLIKDL